MNVTKRIFSSFLALAMLLSLCFTAFAESAEKTGSALDTNEKKVESGLYFDFDSAENPVTDWAVTRYSELDLPEAPAPYTEDGYLVISDIDIEYVIVEYTGQINYTVNPEDVFKISFELEKYNKEEIWIDCKIVVDGVSHFYNLCSARTDETGGVYNTEPLGMSGHVDSIQFHINGFSHFIGKFKVDYIAVGSGIALDPGEACIEIVNVDPRNYRLANAIFSVSGENLGSVSVSRDSYAMDSQGTYWKLKTGAYTTVDPNSVIDGVPVDKYAYDNVRTKYKKRTSTYWENVSLTKSISDYTGSDGVVRFSGLREGSYTIREIQAPELHESLTEEINIQIKWNPVTLEYEYSGAVYEDGLGRLTVVNYAYANGGVDENLRIYYSLDLASDISLNHVVPASCLEGYDMDTVYLEVWIPLYEGNSDVVSGYTVRLLPELRGAYYYFTLKGLTAVQINDYIGATLYGVKDYTVYESEGIAYSVATYALSQLNKSNTSKELKTLCANLLRYGSLAQQYKIYRTYALADEAMTAEHKAYLTELSSVTFANNYLEIGTPESPSFLWNGKGLDLDTRVGIVLRVQKLDRTLHDNTWKLVVRYRNKDDEQISYEITADKAEIVEDRYTFTLSCLDASELRNILTVTVCDETGQSLSSTLIYSADTYGNGKTGLLGDLCKALFAYSDSARAFFCK